MRFAVVGHCGALRMRDTKIMPAHRQSSLNREPAAKLPLFKFLLVVGALLTLGVIAIGSYSEPPISDSNGVRSNGRANASLAAKKP
jgi:hypothetical protein